MHRHIVTGTATALVGLLSAWLFASENPPIDLGNDIENLWRALHIPAWIIAFAIHRNPHGGGMGPVLVGVFVQWFVVGWAGSWLWNRNPRTSPPRGAAA